MIPKEAIEAAISAYMKETDSEPHHLEGWFEPVMSAALTAAFAAMSEPVGYVHADFEKELSCYDVASMVPNDRSCGSFKFIPLYAAPQPAAVKVKPLLWRVFCSRSGNKSAGTPFGEYVVQNEDDGWAAWLPGNDRDPNESRLTASEAVAFCQQHFERCVKESILSALEGGGE